MQGLLPCLKRVYQLLHIGGSRQTKASCGSTGCGKLLDKWLHVLLIEIERRDENHYPEYDGGDKAPPLVAPYGTQHVVVILREHAYLIERTFQFRVHISNILASKMVYNSRNMKYARNGFVIPLLIILAALFLIGGGGAYFYLQNWQKNPSAINPTTQSSSTPQTNVVSNAKTLATSTISILSPKGGEIYQFGSDIPFSWRNSEDIGRNILFAYLESANGNSIDPKGIIDYYSPTNSGTLPIQTSAFRTSKVPSTGGRFKIEVCQCLGENCFNDFTIATKAMCDSSQYFTVTPFDMTAEPAPTASLTANPTSITVGQATMIIATSTHCRFYYIHPGIPSYGAVFPTQTTTYTLTCYETVDRKGRIASASVTVSVSPAPTSASSPYVNTATIQDRSGPTGDAVYVDLTGIGFTTNSKVHISGNGFDGVLSPDLQGWEFDGVNLHVLLPSTIDYKKQYSVYVINGSTKSNTVSTIELFRG